MWCRRCRKTRRPPLPGGHHGHSQCMEYGFRASSWRASIQLESAWLPQPPRGQTRVPSPSNLPRAPTECREMVSYRSALGWVRSIGIKKFPACLVWSGKPAIWGMPRGLMGGTQCTRAVAPVLRYLWSWQRCGNGQHAYGLCQYNVTGPGIDYANDTSPGRNGPR